MNRNPGLRRTTGIEPARFVASVMVASFKRTLVLAGISAMVIGETRVAVGGKWSRRNRPDKAPAGAEFIPGTTEPTALNTGPRVTYTQTFGADQNPYVYTINNPGIYEQMRVFGRVQVNNQTGVTLQDVLVNMTAPPASASVYGILFNHADGYGHLVQFCKVDVPNVADRTEWVSAGIRGRGFRAYRCDIGFTTDGVHPVGKTGYTILRDVEIDSCYLHDFTARFSAAQGTTHDDGVQSFSGTNLTIKNCSIRGGTTSCIILNYAVAIPYGNVVIEDNWLYGDPTAGATINIATSGETIPSLSVKRNRIDRAGHDSGQITVQTPSRIPASFGATSGTTNGIVSDWVYGVDKNYYMDDGSEARIQAG